MGSSNELVDFPAMFCRRSVVNEDLGDETFPQASNFRGWEMPWLISLGTFHVDTTKAFVKSVEKWLWQSKKWLMSFIRSSIRSLQSDFFWIPFYLQIMDMGSSSPNHALVEKLRFHMKTARFMTSRAWVCLKGYSIPSLVHHFPQLPFLGGTCAILSTVYILLHPDLPSGNLT